MFVSTPSLLILFALLAPAREPSSWAEGLATGERWRTEGSTRGEADPSVDRFAITACSLRCNAGPNVTCAVTNTFVNGDIAVDFSQPVEPSSVTPQSFRVIDVATGIAPPGSFLFDSHDPSVVLFRPQLSFDPAGNPVFGFETNATYSIQIDGVLGGGSGPFVLSAFGNPVVNRMLCTVVADQGIHDYTPGPPTVALSPEPGAAGVSVDTEIRLLFDDVMNLGTLVVPGTGLAPFITVHESSGVHVPGTWIWTVDVSQRTTRLDFTPSLALSASEAITVHLPAGVIQDLVGNVLSNPGSYVFTTGAGASE